MHRIVLKPYVIRLAVLVCAGLGTAGCTLDNQKAPGLTGPSEFAQSVTLRATPDRLNQDGSSIAAVTAQVRGPNGAPQSGVQVHFEAAASDGTAVTMTGVAGTTDNGGNTTIGIVAPPAPQFQPATPVTITIQATPVGVDNANSVPRQVVLTLVPPAGLPPPNDLPVADFVSAPATPLPGQNVTFDATASTDSGISCNVACTYAWTFGDGSTGTGLFTSHAYSSPGTYSVTLTVTDAAGGVSKPRAKAVTIGTPTAPAAGTITFGPTPVSAGATVNFDAGGATVGTGATIVSYNWTWGDGGSETTTSAQAQHAFGAAGIYTVRVIVTDSLGRTATSTVSVTVI